MTIPARDNLETMSRTEIQRLCKDNNIKANMRTDEMIDALCELVNGNANVPRPRATSSQLPATSKRAPSQTKPTSSKKVALQPSESNTDVESAASTPAPAITTRRKAKDLQMHLGKGRPVIAGGSGARNITVSTGTRSASKSKIRASSKKVKASLMLNEVITEEDEGDQTTKASKPDDRPDPSSSTTKPLRSPLDIEIAREEDAVVETSPSQLPTPAPSQPSGQHVQFSTRRISDLEDRIAALEASTGSSLPHFETTLPLIPQMQLQLAHLPQLELQISQIPSLQITAQQLETCHSRMREDVAQLAKVQAELQTKISELQETARGQDDKIAVLTKENEGLKERIGKLESMEKDKDVSMSSIIVHNTPPPAPKAISPPPKPVRFFNAVDLPDPSPSQPTLGKRARVDTPDASLEDIPPCGDPEIDAIERIKRPLKKKARLDIKEVNPSLTEQPAQPETSKPTVQRSKGTFGLDPNDDDSLSFTFFGAGGTGPSSTSTPKPSSIVGNTSPPPGLFIAGKKTHAKPEGQIQDPELLGMEQFLRLDAQGEEVDPSHAGAPHTPPRLGSVHDPNFFGGPLPVFAREPTAALPFPLIPTNPATPAAPTMPAPSIGTPTLGEAWRPEYNAHPSSTPTNPTSAQASATDSQFTFRSGGRKERNDQYNPYFTPQRGSSSGRMRTGLTPSKGFTLTLKSPIAEEDEAAVKAATIEEAEENEEGGAEKSPPQLRTLYGTELAGDTRFGDYGRELGNSKGWKWTR